MKKKIIKVALVAVVGLIAGINVFNAQKSDVMSDIALANVEALAAGESSNGKCPTGGMANNVCPIWHVSYTTSSDGVSVTCSTGGSYKCIDGVCPHGN